jgi:NADPH:quinone reductase-like Zn-dependent oxidoreductase
MSVNAGRTRDLLKVVGNLASVPWRRVNPIALMNGNKGVLGVNMGHLWGEAERVAGWLRELVALWEAGALRPVVHAEVPFASAAEAHRLLQDRANLGKVVLVP